MTAPWQRIEDEARDAFRGAGSFPLRAYSEFMPSPWVGLKPYAPSRSSNASTFGVSEASGLDVDEYEQAHDLEPGLGRIAEHLLLELGKLVRGAPHALSHTLLDDNPAWPAELAEAARAGRLTKDPLVVMCALALSRTQDDKGNDRWTLFGASHEGAAAPFFRSAQLERVAALLAWAGVTGEWRILAERDEVLPSLHSRLLGDASIDGVRALLTFRPFALLPKTIRSAYLAGTLALIPHPASLIVHEHPRYRRLSVTLPRATQIPLLHLFPRVERSCAIRIPQSGWLDEHDPAQDRHAHRVVSQLVRTHRWQRVARDADVHGDGAYTDHVSVALFSTEPEAIGLYDKPLARNSQIWTDGYELLLDGPRATRQQLQHAAGVVDAGGRFGYRMYYPPMRAGLRELFWHVPLVARAGVGRFGDAPLGHVTAEAVGKPSIVLTPRLLARPEHVTAARRLQRDPGLVRFATSQNVRKLLDAREQLGRPLSRSHARALLHVGKATTLDGWLTELPQRAADVREGNQLSTILRGCLSSAQDPGAPLVIEQLGTRAVEEQIWRSIAGLAHGEFRQKNDADGITVNRGKHGGKPGQAADVTWHERRDLEALGDHLHQRHAALIEAHGMIGRAEVVDHVFQWETDFPFPWMAGWAKNQQAPHERNVVVMIPGRNRGEAVIMADHYDTAYMEDVYYPESGGDQLRAPACGADDNHSATTALLLAAEHLLPLAKAGRLERDVWLVHLTGEEFPGDCLGARALAQALVERRLSFTAEDGSPRDVAEVTVVGAYVVDMIGHNAERDRDVFQIAPGEGAGSARLALRAHHANLKWNHCVAGWNRAAERHGKARAARMPDGQTPPPPFAHLAVHGEVRVEWEPRSALFNTDGQIFSDLGIPVVLFMENYDINRKGYHDTHDTMENIDLDYCTALTAIAIEAVADTACAADLHHVAP